MIEIILSERDFDYEIQALVNSFFPGKRSRVFLKDELAQTMGKSTVEEEYFLSGEEGDGEDVLRIFVDMGLDKIRVCCRYGGVRREDCALADGTKDFHKHQDKTAHPYRTSYKNKLKSLLFTLLERMAKEKLFQGMEVQIPVWGTMTGVRPTKIPMTKLLEGKPVEQVREEMQEEYHCNPEKGELCIDIATREAGLLKGADYQNGYSLYVGIPFCPTTCLYCSFPSYPVERFGNWIPDYLETLKREIAYCGELMKEQKLTSVYMGGGTPTALSAKQLSDLLRCIRDYFPVEQAKEFTVEAGRPDSITPEKFQALREQKVERISVNPQTMQDRTLERIGRRHTVAQTVEAFRLARSLGFSNINMDLIVGLPGECVQDFEDTLSQIGELDPDSITIHSLVIKRASRLREILDELGQGGELQRAVVMEQMLARGEAFARERGYQPYYMYRQKNSAGYAGSSGQENIGFAREGKECLYNILIMEEMQSILALGAGASTKRYDREKNVVSRVENVKSVTDYINRIDEMLQRKAFLKEGF